MTRNGYLIHVQDWPNLEAEQISLIEFQNIGLVATWYTKQTEQGNAKNKAKKPKHTKLLPFRVMHQNLY